MRNVSTLFYSLAAFLMASVVCYSQCKYQVKLTGKDVRCFGESNGEVTLSVVPAPSGALGPYATQWFDGRTVNFRNDLPAGTHFVKVTDGLGCVVNEFITITQPDLLTTQLAVQHVRCYGEPQGKITSTTGGGTLPYTYQWTNGESTKDISTLNADNYSLTVTDNKSCKVTKSAVVSQPELVRLSSSVTAVSCHGGSDGEIKATVFGGVVPYRYHWSRGDTIPDVYNLISHSHTLAVTDANLCVSEWNIFVPQPLPLDVSFTVKKASCFNIADGEIFAQVTGGNPDYRYKWSNSDFVLGDTTHYPKELFSDYYTLEIIDTKGCELIDSALVIEPNPLVINLEATDATCFNKPDGSVELSISGGTLPYSSLWSTGTRTEDIQQLLAGIYRVDVVDSLGCTRYGVITVGQPDSLSFHEKIAAVSCKEQVDGTIDIKPAGGTPGYSAVWSHGRSGFSLSSLTGGTYSVTVTDAQNCSYNASFIVPVNPDACITKVLVPNTFTPNEDGTNDVWVIHNYEIYPLMEVRVFNKWGNRLFHSIGYKEPWDGTANGSEVQSGTYYYTINLNNGDPAFSGLLTILR
jgi:gliding motility-associated-like protein